MVETVKTSDGFILGYIEWNLLDKFGQFGNEYIYIADVWIHDLWKGYGVFEELVRIVDDHPFSKDVKFVYWDFMRDRGKRIFDNTREDFQAKQGRIYKRRYIADKILKREVLKCSNA